MASASTMTAPLSARRAETADLPDPMPPVSPTNLTAGDGMPSGKAQSRRWTRVEEQVAEHPARALSRREAEVLQLIADGRAPSEVAETLFISPKTVKNHLAAVYAKLGARDRTDAVLRAVRLGIVRL
ncbi:MAG: response regulator transcription factor [Acidimicrobiia bacterium]|nr:response regulator transcription factor [Acidimicrobiia bacterium]